MDVGAVGLGAEPPPPRLDIMSNKPTLLSFDAAGSSGVGAGAAEGVAIAARATRAFSAAARAAATRSAAASAAAAAFSSLRVVL